MSRNFYRQVEAGRSLEQSWTAHLLTKGFHVLPNYDSDANNYLISETNPKIALPDILAISPSGQTIWFECKKKKRMNCHPATGYETRLHNGYRKLQELTGQKVFVLFQDENELYGNWINKLDQHIYANFNCEGKPHTLFKYPEAFLPIPEILLVDRKLAS